MCEGGVFAISEARAVCEQLGLDEDDASIMSAVRSVQYLCLYELYGPRAVCCSSGILYN